MSRFQQAILLSVLLPRSGVAVCRDNSLRYQPDPPWAVELLLGDFAGPFGSAATFILLLAGTLALTVPLEENRTMVRWAGVLTYVASIVLLLIQVWLGSTLLCREWEANRFMEAWADMGMAILLASLVILIPSLTFFALSQVVLGRYVSQARDALAKCSNGVIRAIVQTVLGLVAVVGLCSIRWLGAWGAIGALLVLSIIPLFEPDRTEMLHEATSRAFTRLIVVGSAAIAWSGFALSVLFSVGGAR